MTNEETVNMSDDYDFRVLSIDERANILKARIADVESQKFQHDLYVRETTAVLRDESLSADEVQGFKQVAEQHRRNVREADSRLTELLALLDALDE